MVTPIPWLSFGGMCWHARTAGNAGSRRKEAARGSEEVGLAGEKPLPILMSHWRATAEEARLCPAPWGRETRPTLPVRPSR